MSYLVVFGERKAYLDLLILPMIDTRDFGGENIPSVSYDSPHIGSTAVHWTIADLG